ncbi:MAG: hypothetical protein U0804_11830 [Gemmataceae bacterium]
MPRRESYQTDDDYDDRRGRASGGGGIPGWVWVVVGGGALAVLGFVGMVFFAFTARRDAAMQHEVARAEMMRAEAQAVRAEAERDHDGDDGGGVAAKGLTEWSLERITNAYKNDRAAADEKYTNQRVRVRFEVKTTGPGWVGTSADLGMGQPRDTTPNVTFRFAGDEDVPLGTTVVIVGRCAGLATDPIVGTTLTFTDCRVVRR